MRVVMLTLQILTLTPIAFAKLDKDEFRRMLAQHQNEALTGPQYEALFVQHYPLLTKIARRIVATYQLPMDSDELIGFGAEGLMRAIEKFDLKRGLEFSTYGYRYIWGYMMQELRDYGLLPRDVVEKKGKMRRAHRELYHQGNQNPSENELAAHLGISVKQLQKNIERVRTAIPVSLDQNVAEGITGYTLLERQQYSEGDSDPRLEEATDRQGMIKNLKKAIETLPVQQQEILTRRFFDEHTLDQIGKDMNLSRERIRQIEAKALKKLKEMLSDDECLKGLALLSVDYPLVSNF